MTRRDVPRPVLGHRRADRVMAATGLLLTAYAPSVSRLRPPRPPTPVPARIICRVAEKRPAAERALRLVLAAADGAPLPAWHPGAHIELTLPSGLTRQYSLCGDPADPSTYTVIVRELDNARGPQEIKNSLHSGDHLSISMPRNLFAFAHPALRTDGVTKVSFIAAGIGITPIAPMARLAAATDIDWHLHYLGRSRESMALVDDLAALDPDGSRVTLTTTTSTDRPTAGELLADADHATAVYACGPASLLDDLNTAAAQQHIGSLHTERFAATRHPSGNAFTITLARTGATASVRPDISALEAVEQVAPTVAYSCRQGFCGTCRVRVTAGNVQRRGNSTFLDDPQSMLLCTDTADTDITIDL